MGSESFGPNSIVNGVPVLTFNNPFPAVGSGAIPKQGVRGIPLNSRNDAWAYDQQYNVTLENDLGDGWATRISYVGSKGTSWPYRANLQTPLPSATPFADRPESEKFPWGTNFSFVDQQDLGGTGTYHALEVEATRQFSRGVYVRSWWEWKKNLADVDPGLFSSTIGFEAEDPLNRSRDKGIQNGIPRRWRFAAVWGLPSQRWRFAAVWGLPIGRGQRFGSGMGRFANLFLGDWTTAFIFQGRSGVYAAFTPSYSGSDPSNTGRSSGRPDALCNGNNFGPTPGQGWNPACFAVPPGRHRPLRDRQSWNPAGAGQLGLRSQHIQAIRLDQHGRKRSLFQNRRVHLGISSTTATLPDRHRSTSVPPTLGSSESAAASLGSTRSALDSGSSGAWHCTTRLQKAPCFPARGFSFFCSWSRGAAGTRAWSRLGSVVEAETAMVKMG